MPVAKLDVKWRGKSVGIVAREEDATIGDVKEQIAGLTGVEGSNQKLMFKGKMLQNNETIASCGLKDGDALLMMGTPSASIPKAVEISSEEALSGKDGGSPRGGRADEGPSRLQSQPCGLLNLGNTCYMNASIQSLAAIAEIPHMCREKSAKEPLPPLVQSIGELLNQMSNPILASTIPATVLQKLHSRFPHFAERNDHGMLSQQDAEECWSLIVGELSSSVESISGLFTGQLETTLSNEASGEKITSVEPFSKLSCHISQGTLDLYDGIKAGLCETVTKHSDKLGKSVDFQKTSQVTKLPPYLTVNFVRFFWKPKEQVKAKILKKVKLPPTLSMAQFCSAAIEKEGNQPEYDLVSIVTHIGRSADSGHYIAWVKDPTLKNSWWKCDDETVTMTTDDEIKKLDGGGDWHIAYLCLYKQRAAQDLTEADEANSSKIPRCEPDSAPLEPSA